MNTQQKSIYPSRPLLTALNALVPTDPNSWSVVDGKLYLNANKGVQTRWYKDVPGFIAKADSQ
ncbi:MAG: hypothetical protein DCF15_07210 [Phormidesmis priestleyi]|uniref:Uncharacterized protein n=1 Tax=Phormidesmis priestleyi TaxID=268141 RepID=A0A2W4XMQ2_9CYAN|nr:MAG: hypothetical protein DCF15_07210 [Phormidesmis priestleyi]